MVILFKCNKMKLPGFQLLLVPLLAGLSNAEPVRKSTNLELELREFLFANRTRLDAHTIPIPSNLLVNIGLDINHIIELNEEQDTFSFAGVFRMNWDDDSLTWNKYQYGGIEYITVPSELLWKPDITLYNNVKPQNIYPYTPVVVLLSYKGHVSWSPPVTFHSKCPVDLRNYPYDEQHCKLKFGSWTYDGYQMDVVIGGAGPMQSSSGRENVFGPEASGFGEWELIKSYGEKQTTRYACCDEPYVTITFNVHLRRRAPYYNYSLLIPCVVTSLMQLAIFWLPPMAGEKIMVGVSNLMSLSILLIHLHWAVPRNAAGIPGVVIFCGVSFVFTTLSILIAVFTITFSRTCHLSSTTPKFLRHLMAGHLRTILCVGESKTDSLSESDSDQSKQWVTAAKFIDRICFCLYSIALVITLSVIFG